VVERSWGVATAPTAEEARALADVVDAARPELAEIPGFVDRPLRIHVVPGGLPRNWSGITVEANDGDAWVAVEGESGYTAFYAAHELAHFYLGDLLDRLPPVVEEGYCELIASHIQPAPNAKTWRLIVAAVSYLDHFTIEVDGPVSKGRLGYLVQEVPPIDVALAVDEDELPHLDPRTHGSYYGLGWVVAEAIGLEGLVELDARREQAGLEKVPVAWILQSAGLEPLTQESLEAAFAHALGERRGAGPLTITLEDE